MLVGWARERRELSTAGGRDRTGPAAVTNINTNSRDTLRHRMQVNIFLELLTLHLHFYCQIKREDKVSFAFGLFVMMFGEYLVLRQPHLFVYFYTVTITVLVIRR